MQSKVLVTGGAGFIGSNLVGHLLKEGHDVVVIDNLSTGYASNLQLYPQLTFIEGDILNREDVDRAMDGVDIIFHLAASVGNKRSIDYPQQDLQINATGTLNLLEAAIKHGVQKIVYSSSAGIFGELKSLPIKEDHPIEPDSPYGVSKLTGEKLCLAYAKIYDLEAIALRYFNVYGLNQRYDAYGNVIPIFAYRLFKDMPILIYGDGLQTRDFIHVQDIVQANYKAGMIKGVSGAFNLGSNTRITIKDLANMMADIYGVQTTIEYGSNRPGDVLHSLADISAAYKAFGFQPQVNLQDGVTEYLAWAKKEII